MDRTTNPVTPEMIATLDIPIGMAVQSNPPAVIVQPYLMVTFIPCIRDEEGNLWLEQGWYHDLSEHFNYLKGFTLCGPMERRAGQTNLVPLTVPDDVRFRFVPIPSQTSVFKAMLGLPKTAFVLWRAIRRAEIVHSSVIGWPYPLGLIVNPFAVMQGKALIIVVESSWRTEKFANLSFIKRCWDRLKDLAARWSCKHARVTLFTQASYRDSLHKCAVSSAYVTPAVWVNESDILTDSDAQLDWSRKLSEPVRMLFAGRLTVGKGVNVLLQALRLLDNSEADRSETDPSSIKARVDIIGEGQLRQDCLDAASQLRSVQLRVLDPVPYGPPFFELVRRYHAMIVPSLTDEQPRVVFDANAQAVPVIASDTPGLRPHVKDGITGFLVQPAGAKVLAAAMETATTDPSRLRTMGMNALHATRGHTHVAMHVTRSQILRKHLFPQEIPEPSSVSG